MQDSSMMGEAVHQTAVVEALSYLHDGTPTQKITAAARLAFLEPTDSRVDKALLAAVHDNDREVRRAAAESLVRRDPYRDPRPLLEAIRRSTDVSTDAPVDIHEIREYRLNRLRSPDVLDVLLDAFHTGDPDTKAIAVGLLGETRDDRALQTLRGALDDPAPAIRANALRGLVFFEREAVGDIVRRLEEDTDPDVRAVAAKALGTIGGDDAQAALIQHKDPDRGVRRAIRSAEREALRPRRD